VFCIVVGIEDQKDKEIHIEHAIDNRNVIVGFDAGIPRLRLPDEITFVGDKTGEKAVKKAATKAKKKTRAHLLDEDAEEFATKISKNLDFDNRPDALEED
jgi:hypothetical protein